MKKGLFRLLCAALLCAVLAVCAAGGAEEAAEQLSPDLFNLYEIKDESATWLGTAIPVTNGAVITSCSCLPEDISTLVITDGVGAWDALVCLPDSTGATAVVLFGGEDQSGPTVAPFQFGNDSLAFSAGENYILTGDGLGSRVYRDIYTAAEIQWRGQKCLLLGLSGPAQPGSAVVSEKGELSGIVVAEYAEGSDRVVVFPVMEIRRCLAEASEQLDAINQGLPDNAPEGFKVTADRNKVTFNWHAMTLPEPAEGETVYLIVADKDNNYFTYIDIAAVGKPYEEMYLTPGRTYLSGITVAKGVPTGLPEQYAVTVLPEAKKLTDHEFQSEVCALIRDEADPVPLTEVTEEEMRSGKLRFYSCTHYKVDSAMENISLVISLVDPRGENYFHLSSWLYDPAYMDHDAWSVALEDTELLDMLNMYGYPKGIYTLSMYIWGELADSSTFELK